MSSRENQDLVRVENLLLNVRLADGVRWPSVLPILQPVNLTVVIPHNCEPSARNDDLSASINYGILSKSIIRLCEQCVVASKTFASVENLADSVASICFSTFPSIREIRLSFRKPKALLHAEAVTFDTAYLDGQIIFPECYGIQGLVYHTIIGVNDAERIHQQIVRSNLSIKRSARTEAAFDYSSLANAIGKVVKASSFLTLEALTSEVVRTALETLGEYSDIVTARVSKPSAILFADAAQVEVTRQLADFKKTEMATLLPTSTRTNFQSLFEATKLTHARPENAVSAVIAFGSNLGDRFANIELALRLLEARDTLASEPRPYLTIIDTSFLYETAPMYVTDQPEFINGVCVIETVLEPKSLLAYLKEIEVTVGRVSSIRNGPRAIDLDILTYGNECIDTRPEGERAGFDNLINELVIPHPRIMEREFVLRPLCDVLPDFIHPVTHLSMREHLSRLLRLQSNTPNTMHRVVPFPRYPAPKTEASSIASTHSYWKYPATDENSASGYYRTHLMATLNTTPDSFSDGSTHDTIPNALEYAQTSVTAGADIIDIGGYSTRPGAIYVSPEDEIKRVVPVIEAIRKMRGDLAPTGSVPSEIIAADALISVDTFRADVARAAVLAGANCINDVYGFVGPTFPLTEESVRDFLEFRRVARELVVPVVLMHSRGEASANKDYSAYTYAGTDRDVIEAVRVELGERVDAAVRGPGGLRRWQVIVDPGIGFSKTIDGNLQLLRRAREITTSSGPVAHNPLVGFPQLIGASRKSFLGSILERPVGGYAGRETEPRDRGFATAAAVTSAVQQGALVVRVHDVPEMGDVVRVSNALWK